MRLSRTLVVAATVLAAASLTWAQATASGTYYRLTNKSTYQHGCFAPCACPMQQAQIEGSFLLTPQPPGPLFQVYAVKDVRWQVDLGTNVLHLIGSGTYRVGGEVAVSQQLVLDLAGDDGSTQHFDSGLVPITTPFPTIDIVVSVNHMICLDTAIHVAAVPTKPASVYVLTWGSTWQQGCFGVCDCAIRPPVPLKGRFQLTLNQNGPLYTAYSVDQVEWYLQEQGVAHHITGSGTYTRGGEVAVTQQMVLDLQTDGGPVEHFDSGMVPGGTIFPAIELQISIAGATCMNTWITLEAKPLGDFDLDGAVDQNDFSLFQACLAGSDQPLVNAACADADLDGDGDVDQEDFGIFQRCYSGPDVPADPDCTN